MHAPMHTPPRKLRRFHARQASGALAAAAATVLLVAGVPVARAAAVTANQSVSLYVASTGSDASNDCQAASSPCATISHAVAEASGLSGDDVTVAVAAGTYHESVVVESASEQILAVQGEGHVTVTGLAGAPVFLFDLGTAPLVALDDLTITGGSGTVGAGVAVDTTASMSLELLGDTIDGNTAELPSGLPGGGIGGGVGLDGDVDLTAIDDTIEGNAAIGGSGGAIYAAPASTVSLQNDTIAGNTADTTGGVDSRGASRVESTILSANTGGNCAFGGTFTDGGYNLDSADTCGFSTAKGDFVNTDPALGPLQDNGGPTATMAISTKSPAWHAVAYSSGDCSPADQRGVTRPQPPGETPPAPCDIGAFELSPPSVSAVSPGEGPTAGGTTVDISGLGFTGATAVDFGQVPANAFSCNTDTSCTATSPGGEAGTVDITVTTGFATSAAVAADEFSYLGVPTVTSVSPQVGTTAGNTSITLTGTSFDTNGDTTIDVGPNPANSVSCSSPTTCTAITPAGSPGVADVTVTTPVGTSATSQADEFNYVSANGHYYPVTPYRVLDTRSGLGAPKAPVGPGGSIELQVTGTGTAPDSVPEGATAVVLNVTEADATAPSYLTVWPTGQTRPTASNLNFDPGHVVPNLVEVGLSSSGQVSIYNDSGDTDVVADVEGYVAPAAGSVASRARSEAAPLLQNRHPLTSGLFTSTSPTRILDTRTSLGGHQGPLGAGETMPLTVAGAQGAVPSSGASAVVLNVTVTDATAPSYLSIWPTGATRPIVSNLNFNPGQTVPNRVMVPLGTSGQVSIFNDSGSANVIADVGGWFSDGADPLATGDVFTPASAPVRILDTRIGLGAPQAPIGPNASIQLFTLGGPSPVPDTADAVVANVTVTDTTQASYLTVYPYLQPPVVPTASDLNWPPGATIANLAVTQLGTEFSLGLYNNLGTTDAIADVEGWYAP